MKNMEQPRRRMSDAEISPSCLAMHLVNMIDFRDRSACMLATLKHKNNVRVTKTDLVFLHNW